MPPRPRIAIAGFHHETNTFAPFDTPYESFTIDTLWPAMVEGERIFELLAPMNLPIGGFISACAGAWDLRPVVWTCAEPSGPVSDDAFERIAGAICDGIAAAGRLDGVFLDLHGAMVTASHDDGEGELLRRIRAIVGADLPVVIALDYHANVTPRMVELSSAMAIYRTYPHIDLAETGRRAHGLMQRLLDDPTPFHKGFWQFPYLIPLHAQSTNDWPSNGLFALLPGLETEGVVSADCALGFPAADIEQSGASCVVYGRDAAATAAALKRLEAAALAAEDAFVHRLLPCEEAVALATSRGRAGHPILLADVQDNAGAGATADEPRLLRTLVEAGAKGALLALLWDAEAARAAHEAGVGAELELALGGRYGSDGPMVARFRVESLADGPVRCYGPITGDLDVDLGRMALLRVVDPNSEVRVVVASIRTQCLDRAMVEVMGVDLVQQSIIALKSTNHFRAAFEPLVQEVVMVAAPGVHPCDLGGVEYRRLRPGVRLGPRGRPQPPAPRSAAIN